MSISAGQIVLDTSAYSALRRGDERVIDAVAGAELVGLPVVVLGELEAGFALGARTKQNRRELQALLDEPTVFVLDMLREVARRYGELFAALKRAGTPVPTNDIWIAAATLAWGGHLLTFDGDFARVPGLPHTVLRAVTP